MSKKRIKAACIKPQRGSTGMFYIGSDRHRDEAVFTLFQDDIPALIEQMAKDHLIAQCLEAKWPHRTSRMSTETKLRSRMRYAFARAGLKAARKGAK